MKWGSCKIFDGSPRELLQWFQSWHFWHHECQKFTIRSDCKQGHIWLKTDTAETNLKLWTSESPPIPWEGHLEESWCTYLVPWSQWLHLLAPFVGGRSSPPVQAHEVLNKTQPLNQGKVRVLPCMPLLGRLESWCNIHFLLPCFSWLHFLAPFTGVRKSPPVWVMSSPCTANQNRPNVWWSEGPPTPFYAHLEAEANYLGTLVSRWYMPLETKQWYASDAHHHLWVTGFMSTKY